MYIHMYTDMCMYICVCIYVYALGLDSRSCWCGFNALCREAGTSYGSPCHLSAIASSSHSIQGKALLMQKKK